MNNKTILMIDNHVEFLKTRAEFVQAAGYKVITASKPDKARQISLNKNIDLAVIDLRLLNDADPSDITGLFLAQELHSKMPVIMMTDFPTVETILATLRRDDVGESIADDYISKNDGPGALITGINHLLKKKESVNSAINSWRKIQIIVGVGSIIGVIICIIFGLINAQSIIVISLILGALQVILAALGFIFKDKN